MAGAWTTLSVKDAAGTTRTMRAWDESGTGAGPFSFGQVLTNGDGSSLATFTANAQDVNIKSGVNVNGQAVMAASAPVVPASDWYKQYVWYPGTASNNGLLVAALTLQSTEMNSLANAAVIVSSVGGTAGVFTNSNTAQAMQADLFLTLGAIGSALSAGANLAGWFLTSPDGGTTFESGSVAPPRAPDFIIPLPATTIGAASVFKSAGSVKIPALQFKVLVQNNTGQAFAASANMLKMAASAARF